MAADARVETMNDVAFRSACELSASYRNGSLSPIDVVRTLIRRIDKFDGALNTLISFDAAAAMAAARKCHDELKDGIDHGPLHGIPIAIKDVIDVAGVRTSAASAVTANHVAESDSGVVVRLRAAGAIVFGKTNTHEFACGGPSFDLPFPPARNPWNTDHHPGGSSSGSAAGVAAGLFPLAIGTDTGGSVRHPASACGLVGLKPTYGIVSRRGVFPLAHTLDCVGGLSRTVADAGLLLNAIAGADPRDPSSIAKPWPDCLSDIGKGLKNVRIGYVRHFHEEDVQADAEMAAALDGAARMLSDAGAQVTDVRLPPLESFFSVNRVLLSCEAYAIHAHTLRDTPEAYGALARRALLAGAFLSSEDYILAQKLRSALIARVEACFAEVDLFLCASSMEPPSRLDDPVETRRTYTRQARTPFSVTGNPAITIMAGLSSKGLPLSVQLAARNFEEPLLLRTAAAYEAIRGPAGIPSRYA
jgi:aspartyl-tRNA(Asn)/glutamyl-tRNA(Gln) amidotransferase subunit A